ncbi:MAG: PAS domain S-box protein [Nitrospirae bacterium]|nr:PAS domain S-box protein [Nitrospirota bacterium]
MTSIDQKGELYYVKRALKAIRECQSALHKSTKEVEILNEVCRVIVEEAGYIFAWIGYKGDDEGASLRPLASFGLEHGCLRVRKVSRTDDVLGYGPIGSTIQTGKPFVCRDILTNPQFLPWRAKAIKRGYASSIELPLVREGAVFGTLFIYAAEPNAFDEDEKDLLIGLSQIVSLGILEILKRKRLDEDSDMFFYHSKDMICVASPDGYFKQVNPMFERILGYTKEELLTRPLMEFIHPDDRESTLIEIRKQIDGLSTENFDNRYICKDGSYKIISWSAGPVLEGGKIYAVGRDVTEQRRMQEELEKSEQRYRSMFNDTKAVMLLIEPSTANIVDANDAACSFYGYTKQELTQKKITDINISPVEETSKAMTKARFLIKNQFTFRHRLSNGDIRDVEVLSSPIRVKDSILLFSIIQDVTEKRMLEEQKYIINLICENMLNGFAYCKMIFDEHNNPADFIYLNINKSFEKITGLTKEDVINKKVTDAIPGIRDAHPTLFDLYGRVASTGSSEAIEVFFMPLKIWLFINVYSSEKGYFFAIFEDITERKRLDNELKEINANLQQRVEEEVEKNRLKDLLIYEQSRHVAIGELLMNIAHHWRQPLSAIGAMIQDIEDAYRHKELDDNYFDNTVNKLMKELVDLSKTIDDFRSFYIQDTGKTRINILDAVNKALSILDDYIKSKNISVEIKIDDSLSIYGYTSKFSQVILNLLTNIKDIYDERSITDGTIKINSYRDYKINKVILTITDNGGGISEDIIEKIFDPYFTTRYKSRGTGLSLYISKIIIKSMDGSISVCNTNNGCEFRIEV